MLEFRAETYGLSAEEAFSYLRNEFPMECAAEANMAVADAKLGAIEEFGWPSIILVAIVAHDYMLKEGWLLPAILGIAAYLLLLAPYRRASAKAEAEYKRVMDLHSKRLELERLSSLPLQ